MKLRSRIDWVGTTLLAALGAGPLGCGGMAVVESGSGSGGSGNPGSGGSMSSGGASTGGGMSAGGGPTTNQFPCLNPSPVVDATTGYQYCDDGTMRRTNQAACPSRLPRAEPIPNYDPALDQCQYDSDCSAQPNGYCRSPNENAFEGSGRYCAYGCVTDVDCGTGSICVCGEPIGHCEMAACITGADCMPGFDCRTYTWSPGCGGIGFACQVSGDSCGADVDCGAALCTADGGVRQCQLPTCVIGRPFLVHGVERVAPCAARHDWLDVEIAPSLDGVSPDLRARLADEWARAGQMEHASIAAFARFALQLLSLGAPPSLIERATQAMADETAHAKLCFALASRYRGHDVGPGNLSTDGSLDETTLAEIVKLTIREGCIGETVAAIEAAEAAEHATDPAVREALRRISADETRHAELAWRFVRWAITTFGRDVRELVKAEFARIVVGAPPQPWSDHELLEHGILPGGVREALYAEVLTQVVEPCARAACAAGLHEQPEMSANPALRLT